MRRSRWTVALIPVALALVGGLAVVAFLLLRDDSPPQTAGPPPAATGTPVPTATAPPPATPARTPNPTTAPTATAAPTEDPSATVSANPTGESRDGRPSRCASVARRAAALIAAVEEAMAEYEGIWGLAVVDLDCGSPIIVRPRHSQYPASAGKIVILAAALRAVQDGLLEFALIEENVELVLHYSLDKSTDEIAALVTPEQVGAVMARAGVSVNSFLHWGWRDARFTAHDLALVWASILRGEQLDDAWTSYLLRLASEVVLPEGKETFPAEFGVEGYQYGQKAGYWVPEEDPHFFVSAGYMRPEDEASAGFTFAFLIETWEEDVFEPKRRAVFPLVRDFVVGEVERNR